MSAVSHRAPENENDTRFGNLTIVGTAGPGRVMTECDCGNTESRNFLSLVASVGGGRIPKCRLCRGLKRLEERAQRVEEPEPLGSQIPEVGQVLGKLTVVRVELEQRYMVVRCACGEFERRPLHSMRWAHQNGTTPMCEPCRARISSVPWRVQAWDDYHSLYSENWEDQELEGLRAELRAFGIDTPEPLHMASERIYEVEDCGQLDWACKEFSGDSYPKSSLEVLFPGSNLHQDAGSLTTFMANHPGAVCRGRKIVCRHCGQSRELATPAEPVAPAVPKGPTKRRRKRAFRNPTKATPPPEPEVRRDGDGQETRIFKDITCNRCGSGVFLSRGPGRTRNYFGDHGFEVPAHLEFLECARCGGAWMTRAQAEELSKAFEAERERRRRNYGNT